MKQKFQRIDENVFKLAPESLAQESMKAVDRKTLGDARFRIPGKQVGLNKDIVIQLTVGNDQLANLPVELLLAGHGTAQEVGAFPIEISIG